MATAFSFAPESFRDVRLSVPPSRGGFARDRFIEAVLSNCHDMIIALDAHGAVRFENPAVSRLIGVQSSVHEEPNIFDLIHPEDRIRVAEAYAVALEKPRVPVNVEFRLIRKDGSFAYVESVAVNLLDDPRVRSVIVNARDVTEQRFTDPQTGLASRILLSRDIDALRLQESMTYSLLAIRAERFERLTAGLTDSQIRELFGTMARTLRAVAGPDDLVARLDKDTFALLARGTGGIEGAMTVVSRVRRAFNAPIRVGRELLEIEARIGLASGPAEVPGEDFIKNAEIALDAATAAPVGVFDPSMRERARSRIAVEADLRRAICSEELVAFYQPILHAASGRVEGFEALVRWKKPDGTLIPPGAFIPIAEESGLIRALDFRVLESACRFVRRVREKTGSPDVFVNVNLSTAHFADGALPRSVKDVLDAAGVPGSALKLEVTETALIENAEVAAATMRALASHGVRFGLDDFGTGYSSLSYLHRFPFETLKIDRSFIRSLGSEQGRPELAEAIVLLARALGLTVVAEGVETASQLEFLTSRRCDYVQGFLFSPAVPDLDAEQLIREQPYLCAAPSAAAE